MWWFPELASREVLPGLGVHFGSVLQVLGIVVFAPAGFVIWLLDKHFDTKTPILLNQLANILGRYGLSGEPIDLRIQIGYERDGNSTYLLVPGK